MTVSDLIRLLSECDPDANVFLMHQRNYPLESTLYGVSVREEFSEEADDEHAPNDVVLLEGSHVGYGASDAWGTAARA